MKLTFENIAIVLGGLAVAYVISKVVKEKAALQSISNVQYSPEWSDNITGNQAKDNLLYV